MENLTPAMARAVQFTERRKGYDEGEVDAFVDHVCETLADLYSKLEAKDGDIAAKDADVAAKVSELAALKATAGVSQESEDKIKELHEQLAEAMEGAHDRLEAQEKEKADLEAQLAALRAELETRPKVPDTVTQAVDLLALARKTADDTMTEASSKADALVTEAQAHADQVNAEAASHAETMRAKYQDEELSLKARVDDLRNAESGWRDSFRALLAGSLASLDEPAIVPAAPVEEKVEEETPAEAVSDPAVEEAALVVTEEDEQATIQALWAAVDLRKAEEEPLAEQAADLKDSEEGDSHPDVSDEEIAAALGALEFDEKKDAEYGTEEGVEEDLETESFPSFTFPQNHPEEEEAAPEGQEGHEETYGWGGTQS